MKGSKSGSKKQQAPYVAPDSAASISRANLVYGLAEGEIAGLANGYNSIYLDGTPIENNTGVPNLEGITIDFRKGTNDQEPMLGFPNLVNQIDYNNVEITTEKPFIHHINDTQYTTAAVRVTFGALFRTNATTGETLGNTIEYAIDVQVDGNGFAEYSRYVVSDKTSANYERRHEITLPEADQSWDIRVRRITPNQNSQYIGDKMYATSVAQIINAQYVYPNTSVLGVKYDASRFSSIAKLAVRLKGKIIRIPANLNPETGEYATRGQGTTNGTWNGEFKWAYSNNPAWVYYDLCLSERYGLGNRIKQNMIDKFTLYTVGKYCDQKVPDGYGGLEKRFTVNVYIQSYFEAFELLSQLAGVFRGIIYYNGLSIKMEIDRPRDPVYTYNRTNTIGGFAYKGTKDKDRYSVITAEYDEPSLDFKTQPVTVFSKQAMQELGVRRKTIQCFGCTSRGQAQRAAYWALYKNIYETRLVTFRVGLDGFIAPTGRIIEVADPKFAGRANSGRVAEVSSDQRVIKLDVECGEVGDRIVVNGDDGISQSREILGISGSTITVSSPFDGISAEAAFAVESDDLNTLKFTVVSVTQDTGNDTPSFTITAVQHEPQIFDAAENDVFIEPPPVSVINPEAQEPVSNVTVMSETKVVQGISITNLIVVWDQVVGAVKYDIRWKKDSGQWINSPNNYSNTLIVEDVYTGDYVAEVVAISATDLRSVPKQSNITHIVARYVEPPPLATISAKGILFGVEISFNFLAGSENAEYTEIRVSELNDHSDAKTLTFVPYPKKDFTYSGLQGGKTFYYQARIVDRNGYPGPWSAWVYATVDANPDLILDLIEGELSEGMLDQELRDKISAANTNAQEALNTANQVKGETAQSISDLNANLDTERSERIANVSTLTNGVTTAQTTADGAISQLNNYKSSNDTALANMQTQINTAVDNSSAAVSKVDALDGRVQAAETNSASALSKANITINDVSALSQTVQQNTAAIGNKADTTYVDSVKSTADAADGKATANTTAIQGLQARVGNNESTINNIQQTKANKDEVASIAQTALQSTWQNDAQAKVDALQIGGTNILLGTEKFDGWGVAGYAGITSEITLGTFAVSKATSAWSYLSTDLLLEQGKVYTLSGWIQSPSPIPVGFFGYIGSGEGLQLTVANAWTRWTHTFTAPHSNAVRIRLESGDSTPSNPLYVCGLKLETGNKATDWSPAPSDVTELVQSNINNLKSEVSQTYQTKSSANETTANLTQSINSKTSPQDVNNLLSAKVDAKDITYRVNLNDMRTVGLYLLRGGWDNGAYSSDGATWHWLEVKGGIIDNRVQQTMFPDNSTGTVTNRAWNGTWSDWNTFANTQQVNGLRSDVQNTYSTKTDTTNAIAQGINSYKASLGSVLTYKLASLGLGNGGWAGINNAVDERVWNMGRSYGLADFYGGNLISFENFDLFQGGKSDELANRINAIPDNHYIAVITYDEPATGRTDSLRQAFVSIGGTSESFNRITYRGAYMLVGRKGLREGGGLELISDGQHLEYILQFINGVPVGVGGNSSTAQQTAANASVITQTQAQVGSLQNGLNTLSQQTTTLTSTVNTLGATSANLLKNSDFSAGLDSWWYWSNIGGGTGIRNPPDDWAVVADESRTAEVHVGGNSDQGGYACILQTVPVVSDKWYQFSGFTGVHRSSYHKYVIYWNNLEGQRIASQQIDATMWAGGKKLSDYFNAYFNAQAPSGAVSATCEIGCGGGSDVYMFMTRFNFCQVANASAALVPWSPSSAGVNSQLKTQTATIQQQAQVQNGILGIYTIKIDNNGVMSGFGLISELIDGQVRSQFGVNADTFFIGNPANGKKPFVVLTSPGIINGVSVPAGTYIDTGFIADLTVTTAKINDAAITSAKIADASITTAKIGDLQVDTLKIKDRAVTAPHFISKAGIAPITLGPFNYSPNTYPVTTFLDWGLTGLPPNQYTMVTIKGMVVVDIEEELTRVAAGSRMYIQIGDTYVYDRNVTGGEQTWISTWWGALPETGIAQTLLVKTDSNGNLKVKAVFGATTFNKYVTVKLSHTNMDMNVLELKK